MKRVWRTCALMIGVAFSIALHEGALAQKSGSVLKATHRDSPASMSINLEIGNSAGLNSVGGTPRASAAAANA